MAARFKVGDLVECVDPVTTQLTARATYTVLQVRGRFVVVNDGTGDGYVASRFVLVRRPNPSQEEPAARRSEVTVKPEVTGGSSSYYKLPPGCTDLQDIIEYRGMSFAQGNIFKAAYRMGIKPGVDEIYDLDKIIWFAERRKAELQRKSIHQEKESP